MREGDSATVNVAGQMDALHWGGVGPARLVGEGGWSSVAAVTTNVAYL